MADVVDWRVSVRSAEVGRREEETSMWFAMLALGVGCFATLWGFVWACEKV